MENERKIERETLLKEFSKRDLSQVCLMKIICVINNAKDKELVAKKTTTLLDKNEEEILKLLNEM